MPTVKYLGHSALMLYDSKYTVFIDPFINGNPLAPIKTQDIEKCDYILVTHGHSDHLGDTMEIAQRHKSTVVATWELARFLEAKGLKVHPMAVGGGHAFPFGRVKMTPALHGCGGGVLPDNTPVPPNTPAGFLVTWGKKTLYHAGDTALFSDMRLLGEKKIDLAFLPIGDNFTMDSADAARAAEFLNAERCVPMHYDTFELIKADAQAFALKIEKQGQKCIILKPGETVEL